MASKTKAIYVRVSTEDHAAILANAAAARLGVSEYMRRKALEGDALAARVAKLEETLDAIAASMIEEEAQSEAH